MLSKCANPDCSAKFRYLHEGKLYLVDYRAAGARRTAPADSKSGAIACAREYFWLCGPCSFDMTIQIDDNLEIRVTQRRLTGCGPYPEMSAALDLEKNASAP
jgi:hypothetical protein